MRKQFFWIVAILAALYPPLLYSQTSMREGVRVNWSVEDTKHGGKFYWIPNCGVTISKDRREVCLLAIDQDFSEGPIQQYIEIEWDKDDSVKVQKTWLIVEHPMRILDGLFRPEVFNNKCVDAARELPNEIKQLILCCY